MMRTILYLPAEDHTNLALSLLNGGVFPSKDRPTRFEGAIWTRSH